MPVAVTSSGQVMTIDPGLPTPHTNILAFDQDDTSDFGKLTFEVAEVKGRCRLSTPLLILYHRAVPAEKF
jgi:hypothetical protein